MAFTFKYMKCIIISEARRHLFLGWMSFLREKNDDFSHLIFLWIADAFSVIAWRALCSSDEAQVNRALDLWAKKSLFAKAPKYVLSFHSVPFLISRRASNCAATPQRVIYLIVAVSTCRRTRRTRNVLEHCDVCSASIFLPFGQFNQKINRSAGERETKTNHLSRFHFVIFLVRIFLFVAFACVVLGSHRRHFRGQSQYAKRSRTERGEKKSKHPIQHSGNCVKQYVIFWANCCVSRHRNHSGWNEWKTNGEGRIENRRRLSIHLWQK